jgi:D-alanyl-D-alanine carboxypeptidase (penicillin-binding protein 5/6)
VVRPGEAAAYPAQARNGDSLVPVTAGEQLTERQALEALLLPSADNMAWILARWDAGSQAAFTAQMNTTARRLGMTDTHYTDPSGLSASTTSTAADQVRLGMAAMSETALAQIVALRSAVIPVAGVVRNYNTLLGQDGITGLKTGSDTAAGGCILLGAWTRHSHRRRHVRSARHDGENAAQRAAGRPPACAGTGPRPCWPKRTAHQRQESRKASRGSPPQSRGNSKKRRVGS